MNETLVKYLAGLLDADGCLSFNFRADKNDPDEFHVSLRLVLSASDNIDKDGFVESLYEKTGFGTVCRIPPNKTVAAWTVSRRSDLEMLLPRVIKHMVIKARHWQWLLDIWRKYRGLAYGQKGISIEERELLSAQVRLSRKNVGPLKPKNHPSWAWLAGYLDGDGHYTMRLDETGRNHVRVGATAHIDDAFVLSFIEKAFGGFTCPNHKRPNVLGWYRNLGSSETSFALRFLPNLAKHSKFKRRKIDDIIRWHRQRLRVSSTVCGVKHCYKQIRCSGLCQLHYNRLIAQKRKAVGVSDSLNV